MTDFQRIFVVGAQAGADEVTRLRSSLRSGATVLTAPTAEARRVVEGLGVDPVPDVLLAPVRFPDVDRGHRLDELVRRHALRDRFRDVVVVTDAATVTLLLRALAPDQLPMAGAVTEVGLPRGPRPVPLLQAALGGSGSRVRGRAGRQRHPDLGAPAPRRGRAASRSCWCRVLRHLGEALLISVAVSVAVSLLAIAGSSRFPGSW